MADQRDHFDPVVKRRDAARRLGCCVGILQNLEARGELTPIFITGKLSVTEIALCAGLSMSARESSWAVTRRSGKGVLPMSNECRLDDAGAAPELGFNQKTTNANIWKLEGNFQKESGYRPGVTPMWCPKLGPTPDRRSPNAIPNE